MRAGLRWPAAAFRGIGGMSIDCGGSPLAQCAIDFFWSALPLLIAVVWLVAFLGFGAVVAVDLVWICVDIFTRAKKWVPPPWLRPVMRRVAFILLPVLLLGAAAVFAVMHLAR
jgi:hypothetical protein